MHTLSAINLRPVKTVILSKINSYINSYELYFCLCFFDLSQ